MAVTIDWSDKVIYVPKTDLVLIQETPVEIREMNLNWFRLQLKDIEDSTDGIVNLDTHRHNTETTLGGLTYARVIEIINGYTVTFEDGQYAVNLVGANSNVADVVNVNQVSVRSANSAGMTSSQDIVYGSYNGGVHIDFNSPFSGTIHPVGTPRQKVNNLSDANLIADYNGFDKFFLYGSTVVDTGGDYRNKTFIGESPSKTVIEVSSEAQVEGCEFYEAHVVGTLDGDLLISRCLLTDLDYFYGYIEQCFLAGGKIELGGGNQAVLLDCWTGKEHHEIDMGGSGQSLVAANLNGHLKITNKTGPEQVTLFLNSGSVRIDLDTVINGIIHADGIGELQDAEGKPLCSGTYGNLVVENNLTNVCTISDGIMERPVEGLYTMEEAVRLMLSALAGKLSGASTTSVRIRDINDTKDRIVAIVDEHGNRTAVEIDEE